MAGSGPRGGALVITACLESGWRLPERRSTTYPTPSEVIVPFARAARPTSVRVVLRRLQQSLGSRSPSRTAAAQPPDRSGRRGALALRRSVLMFTTAAPITIAPLMNDKVQYDPRKDIVPIAVVAVMPCGSW